jgi:hypothetical protein
MKRKKSSSVSDNTEPAKKGRTLADLAHNNTLHSQSGIGPQFTAPDFSLDKSKFYFL